MKKFLWTFLFVIAGAPLASSEIAREPNYTLLWNSFTTVTVVDSFAVVTGNDGLEVLKIEPRTSLYRAKTHLFLSSKGRERKQYGSVLVVRTYDNLLHFFDLSRLPDLHELGSVDIGVPYSDFAVHNQNLYVTCGFKGIWRYRLDGYQSTTFVDSSMIGIHCVKVDISGNELLAIDDYNGVLRYRLKETGFGQFVDYLYIPFVARSMVRRDSTLAILAGEDQLWVAQLHAQGTPQLDSIGLLFNLQAAYITDTMIVGLGGAGNLAAFVNRADHHVYYKSLKGEPAFQSQGSIRSGNERTDLVIPGSSDLLTYHLDDISINAVPSPGLDRPGPITSLFIANNLLYTAGVSNPLDVYGLGADGSPTFDTTIFPGLPELQATDRNGDTLFAFYPSLQQILILELGTHGPTLEGSIPVGLDNLSSISFARPPNDTMSSILAIHGNDIDIWGITDSGLISHASTIRMLARVLKVVSADSFLVVTTIKGLWVYRLFPDLTVAYRYRTDLVDQVNDIRWYDNRLYVFIGNNLIVYGVSRSGEIVRETAIDIPTAAYNSVVSDRRMYTVGPFGMTVIDVGGFVPTVLDWGGRGGSLIAAGHGVVAISDGASIHLFDLRGGPNDVTETEAGVPSDFGLAQNYPNPFNAVTTIDYRLDTPSNVRLDIVNVLGERVAILTDAHQAAGRYRVQWDGTNQRGHGVATGVYFYRMEANGREQSRKMLLLK